MNLITLWRFIHDSAASNSDSVLDDYLAVDVGHNITDWNLCARSSSFIWGPARHKVVY